MTGPQPRSTPRAVAVAQVVLAGISALHLIVVGVTLTHQAALRQDAAAEQSVVGPVSVAMSSTALALTVHIPLFLLTGFLAAKLTTGHPWVLKPVTVSQACGIVFARLSTPPLHVLDPLVVVMIAASATIIALLWIPHPSRDFFASHPHSRQSRSDAGKPQG